MKRTLRGCVGVVLLALVGLGAPALTQSTGAMVVAAAPGNVRAPFPDAETWYVFQGYNSGTHTGTSSYGIDLTTSRSTTSTGGAGVVVPASGTILYWQAEFGNLCVNTPDGRSYTLTHISASRTSGSVTAGQRIGSVAPAGQARNNGVAHLHYEWWSGPGCYGQSSPLPFDSGHRNRICGAPDMTHAGPSAWGNGTWSGQAITSTSCGVAGVSPQGSFDDVEATARGQITVRGWAFDRDRPEAHIGVQIYVGGPAGVGERHMVTADASRADVGNAHPGMGDSHGFDDALATSTYGLQEVFVYAVNHPGTGGSNVLLGSKKLWITPSAYGGSHWELVGGRFQRISLGPGGNLWAVKRSGAIAQYTGGGTWERRGRGFKDVAVGMPSDAATGGPQVYAVTKDNAVRRWRADGWEVVPGKFVTLDFGPSGALWAVARNGRLSQYAGGGAWRPRGQGFAAVTTGMPLDAETGGPRTYAVRADSSLQRLRGDVWEDVPGRAKRIDFGLGELWAITPRRKIVEYTGGGRWRARGRGFIDVAVGMPGDGVDSPRVYALRDDGSVVRWRR